MEWTLAACLCSPGSKGQFLVDKCGRLKFCMHEVGYPFGMQQNVDKVSC